MTRRVEERDRRASAIGVSILAAIVLAGSGGCGVQAEGPPEIVVDRTACAHCGMLISEPLYAAAYRTPGQEARAFDDIGCLLEAARREPETAPLRFWFQDAGGGGWIDGRSASFVRAPALSTPMGGGLIAFGDAAAAERSARAAQNGRVIRSLRDLLAEAPRAGGL